MKNTILVIVAVCLLLSNPVSGATRDNKLRIGWVYAMANMPILVADKKGFFKEQGIDVEIRRFNSGPLINRALRAGDLDMAYIGMPPVYHAYEKGLKLKIVAKVNHGQAAIIVRKDSAIKQLSDLKGKRIAGVRNGSGMDVLLRGFILDDIAGLNPDKDLTIVHMPAKIMQASVDKGVVDAAFTWEPFVTQAIVTGQSRVLFDMNQAVNKYPWYVVAATEDTIHLNFDLMSKALNAHQKAVRFMNESPDEANLIVAEAFNLYAINTQTGSKIDPVVIVEQARSRIGWSFQFEKEDKQFLQKLIDYSHRLGFIKKKINADEIIDQSVIGSVYK